MTIALLSMDVNVLVEVPSAVYLCPTVGLPSSNHKFDMGCGNGCDLNHQGNVTGIYIYLLYSQSDAPRLTL